MTEKLKVGDLCRIRTGFGPGLRGWEQGDIVLVFKINPVFSTWNVHTLHQRLGIKQVWTEESLEKVS